MHQVGEKDYYQKMCQAICTPKSACYVCRWTRTWFHLIPSLVSLELVSFIANSVLREVHSLFQNGSPQCVI